MTSAGNVHPDETNDNTGDPDPDHAWKLLSLVNEWIRHADAKATVTLAFTGAMGTLLFNMVKGLPETGVWTNISAVSTCAFLVAAGVLCGLTLTPRTKDIVDDSSDEVNRIFYAHISKHFRGQRVEYRDVIKTLTADSASLTDDLADQIHANARIATVKNQYVKWAIRAMLCGGLSLAIVAALIAR